MRYYQASEARRVLGNITPKQLKKLVDRGKLNRYTPPKGGRDVYSAAEVNALARDDRAFWGEDEGEQEHVRAGRRTVDDSSRSKTIQC